MLRWMKAASIQWLMISSLERHPMQKISKATQLHTHNASVILIFRRLLAKNAKKVKEATEKTDIEEESQEVIKRNETPKLLKTVIRVLSPNSHIHDYLNAKKQKSATDGEVKVIREGEVQVI